VDDLFEHVTGGRAGWLDPGSRGLIRATGSDRVRFLNGMVSNDVEALASGEACWATLLDRKGHVLSDLWVLALSDAILLDTAAGTGDEVFGMLDRHLIADDVALENLSESWGARVFEGPDCRDQLRELGHPVPAPSRVELDDEGRIWLGAGALSADGVRVLAPRTALPEPGGSLPRIEDGAAEILRVERARPLYGVDVGPRNFPLEGRMDAAISDTKGCYIGQEIIARLISRGAVNKFLVQLSTERAVSVGDEIRAGATKVGAVTSVAESPERGPLALGYVRRAESEVGTALDVGGVPARVVEPAGP
jgi:folate-binding protein YgfZ